MKRFTTSFLALFTISSVMFAGEIVDIEWKLGPNLPEFRKGGCATAMDGKVISVFGMRQPWGEMATMYVYDPATDWWSRGVDGPAGQTYVQGTECGGAFYAIGGRQGKVRVECYRLSAGGDSYSWHETASLNDARGWAPSATLGSRLFVFGGAKSGRGPTLSSVEMLDTSDTDAAWKKVSDIPGLSRGWLGAAAAGGKIYVIGGSHFFDPKPEKGPDRQRLAEVLEFDPETCEWETKSPPLAGMDTCVYEDRYIIVVGGAPSVEDFTPELRKAYEATDRYPSYYCPFVLVYDTQTDQWRTLPSPLPVPTNDVRVVLIDKKLYVLGGENVEPATSNTTAWFRIGNIVE
ncbi:MAG: hypothetical protein GWP08_11920 [Nitrospiraceae bacterium]|nr:hypothetical protein [Nitrospiraceae bacterium]